MMLQKSLSGVFKPDLGPRQKSEDNKMEGLPLLMLIVYSILVHTTPEILARSCSPSVGLKSNNLADKETQIDLSQLSEKQLKQLVQQLAKFQTQKDIDEEDEVEQEQLEDEDYENQDEDHRGSSRPWNKVQRIIRRQLVKIPRRYLKKLLRQFGLARSSGIGSLRNGDLRTQVEEYYLIPLE
ncbi:uncharacterized protein Dana_GF20015 [Drosophila ananassae]|uniref:Uncharacterized protein n=2 Tax=Drosophila ananassae TaxID=7217 RepID=B3MWD7_DROAN|nr:uncharacterized protein Dana_GF20015 [Drosophila ananassae]